MNRTPVRLGPLALLLLVVGIALSTLSILSFTTARADMVLAERFASSVETRYELEKEGNKFIYELKASGGTAISDKAADSGDAYHYENSLNGYTLTIEIGKTDQEVRLWQIRKDWDYDEHIDNLWDGE